MSSNHVQLLRSFLNHYQQYEAFTELGRELDNIDSERQDGVNQLIQLYHRAIPAIEQQIWSREFDESLLLQYQALFRELEQHLAKFEHDSRHHIVIVIPVADRPQHLQACMQSILELCEYFEYGGKVKNQFNRVSVLISDDSRQKDSIQQHQALAKLYTDKGLNTEYFGQDEQLEQINKLKQPLATVIGSFDHHAFYHKGSSITRNITYLRLNQLANEFKSQNQDVLFYFIDSDQEFKINLSAKPGEPVAGLNYFYHLDRIFTRNRISMLTGKVVGDPPVSPAVMASTFLNDVNTFLERLSSYKPESACEFHASNSNKADDAAYHDMANLFGFEKQKQAFHYQCPLTGKHDHIACFNHLASQLNHFFDGEHPTRRLYFEYKNVVDSVVPARTVYTGNYIFKPEMLAWFIPFASLKLRMAGPVLGRLIRAAIGEQFVSANLPMLHKRTLEQTGQSEFRPGIERAENIVDLSGEFERQYFGDVMLFSIEKLVEHDFPDTEPDSSLVAATIQQIEAHLLQQYQQQHEQIMGRLVLLENTLNNQANWWNQGANMKSTLELFHQFINNMQDNFGDKAIAYQRINNEAVRAEYRQRILAAICSYPESKQQWQQALNL